VELVGKHGADAPEQIRAYIRSLKTAVEAARKEVA
jgi:tryptophan synthase alpha chain